MKLFFSYYELSNKLKSQNLMTFLSKNSDMSFVFKSEGFYHG
jgi:hypothetical protein